MVVSLPGTTYRAAATAYTSAAGGHFYERVLNWGGLNYAISDRSGTLPAVTMTVRVADTDRTLARIYEGSRRDEIRGSAVSIYLMTPTVAYSTEVVFVGIVAKISFPAPFQAEFTLKTNDDQLQRLSPGGGWIPNRVTWPRAKAEVFDKTSPILFGIHDASYTQTGPGLVKCLLVDTTTHVYLVCAGRSKGTAGIPITRVYVDNVQTSASNYTASYTTIGGRSYTIITFTSSIPTESQTVTCDAEGYESVGDGTGSTVTNPATQWAMRLSNFVLADYMTGSWLSTHALIDATKLTSAEAYFTLLGAHGSTDEDAKRTGREITAAYCKSFGMRSFWTRSGKVAMSYENIFALPYTGYRLQWYKHELGAFSLLEDDFQVTNRIVIRFNRSSSQDTYLATLEAVDASVTTDIQDAIDLEMSEAR
jgi:hypothetical protein